MPRHVWPTLVTETYFVPYNRHQEISGDNYYRTLTYPLLKYMVILKFLELTMNSLRTLQLEPSTYLSSVLGSQSLVYEYHDLTIAQVESLTTSDDQRI